MRIRSYGTSGPLAAVVHGGPGAPGSMAPVARALAARFRILEPLQRGSGDQPLTVARHVADLHELVRSLGDDEPPALVGHSWGAMLVLAYAAAHPDRCGPLVLVGCGTFEPAARARLHAIVEERTDEALRAELERLPDEHPDPDDRLRATGELLLAPYSFELASTDLALEPCDLRAHRETWADMERLQEEGRYPAAFAAIRAPVLMLHGAADPHPGAMIRASLAPHLPQLEYRELARCGHYPWLEKHARAEFFAELEGWLLRHTGNAPG